MLEPRVPSKESLGPKRVEGREGQREREQRGPAGKASSGTDCRTCSSVRKENCRGVRPATGLDELAGHIEAPNMGAGGSHHQATMMPDPWATYERSSANEGQATTSAPPETNKGTFALTKGFRKGRSRSATRNVETRNMVGAWLTKLWTST